MHLQILATEPDALPAMVPVEPRECERVRRMSAANDQSGPRPRARDIGLRIGSLPIGSLNAITDVPGVRVGQTTLISGDGALVPGRGPVRTGVTVILPHEGNLFREKVPAAVHVINGFGKCLGQEQIDELGVLEGPIALTNTLNVGLVFDALVTHGVLENPDIGIHTSTINGFVGECSDMHLNDIQGRHVREEHVLAAIDGAENGPVAEGAVGAGTGMVAFGYKGGIGSSSRVIPSELGGWTVGVLVLANFGRRGQLVIDGVPVGRLLAQEAEPVVERGSIMLIVGTDAPLLDRGLRRIARRTGAGLARTGSTYGHGSGDYALAFSTAPSLRVPHEPRRLTQQMDVMLDSGRAIDALFQATVEATEEAVLNALFRATTVVGRDGNRVEALPVERVRELLRAAGRVS
jgi:D-aminopeptidase